MSKVGKGSEHRVVGHCSIHLTVPSLQSITSKSKQIDQIWDGSCGALKGTKRYWRWSPTSALYITQLSALSSELPALGRLRPASTFSSQPLALSHQDLSAVDKDSGMIRRPKCHGWFFATD